MEEYKLTLGLQEKGEFKVLCRQKPSVRQDFLM